MAEPDKTDEAERTHPSLEFDKCDRCEDPELCQLEGECEYRASRDLGD